MVTKDLEKERSELLGKLAEAFPQGARLLDGNEELEKRVVRSISRGDPTNVLMRDLAVLQARQMAEDSIIAEIVLENCSRDPGQKIINKFFEYYSKKGYKKLEENSLFNDDGRVVYLTSTYSPTLSKLNVGVRFC